MNAKEVPDALVEKAARAAYETEERSVGTLDLHPWSDVIEDHRAAWRVIARHALAAVLPEVKREFHHEGYETARGDLGSGAFIGGPTYEALRDSFTGRQIQAEALRDAHRADPWRGVTNDGQWLLDRAARLTATTTEEPTT